MKIILLKKAKPGEEMRVTMIDKNKAVALRSIDNY